MADGSTKEEILTAAGEVLASSGIEGFTTAAVADKANVSQGLVHHYFETKHDLLRHVFEWGWENTQEDIRKISDTDDARNRLLTFAGYLITPEEQLDERLSVARIDLELRAQAIHDAQLREVFNQWRAEMLNIGTEIIKDGIERGQFRPVDVDHFAAVFVSGIVEAEQLFAIYSDPGTSQSILAGLAKVVDECLVNDTQNPHPTPS